MNRIRTILLSLELSAFPVLMVLSWVCNIYGMPAKSLLDNRGLRWVFTSLIDNFSNPLLPVLVISLLSLGAFLFSGLSDCLLHPRRIRLKQQRALMFTLASIYVMLALLLLLIYKPNSVLLNFFGGYSNSPLTDAIPTLVIIFVEVISSVYGYTSGRIITSSDFIRAHTWLLQKSAPLFFHFFLLSQLYAWVNFVFLS